jgi:hypothetical protein
MKYLNLENGIVYTQTGITEKKVVMGKEFTLMQCTASDGNKYLVPIQRFDNPNYFKKL